MSLRKQCIYVFIINFETCFTSFNSFFGMESEVLWKMEIIRKAEELVEKEMSGNDASHDAAHAFRVRDLALSLAHEETLSTSPDSILIVSIIT